MSLRLALLIACLGGPALGQAAAPADSARAEEIVTGYDRQVARQEALRPAVGPQPAVPLRPPPEPMQRLEIDGLVVDETLTRPGRDFYHAFFMGWRAPRGAYNFTVRVQEQPVPNLGTRVVVYVNDEVAFQANLQPRIEMIEEAAQMALAFTYRMLQARETGPSPF